MVKENSRIQWAQTAYGMQNMWNQGKEHPCGVTNQTVFQHCDARQSQRAAY